MVLVVLNRPTAKSPGDGTQAAAAVVPVGTVERRGAPEGRRDTDKAMRGPTVPSVRCLGGSRGFRFIFPTTHSVFSCRVR